MGNCNDVNPDHPIGLYDCDNGDFPALALQFATSDKKDAKASKNYEVRDYTQAAENGRRRLLIREAGQYEKAANSAVPALKGKKNENVLVLGTVFLQNVYTYFNLENNSVNLSQA